jgi:hypothetical protein
MKSPARRTSPTFTLIVLGVVFSLGGFGGGGYMLSQGLGENEVEIAWRRAVVNNLIVLGVVGIALGVYGYQISLLRSTAAVFGVPQ